MTPCEAGHDWHAGHCNTCGVSADALLAALTKERDEYWRILSGQKGMMTVIQERDEALAALRKAAIERHRERLGHGRGFDKCTQESCTEARHILAEGKKP